LSDCTEGLIKICSPYDGPLRFEKRWVFKNTLTQPLTEIITINISEGKGWSARKADNLIAICEPIV
jgi:hypothetical protein